LETSDRCEELREEVLTLGVLIAEWGSGIRAHKVRRRE